MSYQQGGTRLESHRKEFMGAKTPMTGPLLRFSDLSFEERAVLERDITTRLVNASVTPTAQFYLEVFNSWGIMCPHPIYFRLYDGFYRSDKEVPFDDCIWYKCNMCQCSVINRE